ncbi:MAG: 4Fe-4S dicluster domain-containing protein [Clostridia bacterium]|nr:4Fe-4S dicluster domain-containing protein [Clostridia bacterium]
MTKKEISAEIERVSGTRAVKCMRCGKCSATCPAYGEMDILPHEFVYLAEKGDIEKLAGSAALYRCMSCFACVERCPRQVEPANIIEAIRLRFIRPQGANHLKADDIPALIDGELPQQAIVSAFRKYSK